MCYASTNYIIVGSMSNVAWQLLFLLLLFSQLVDISWGKEPSYRSPISGKDSPVKHASPGSKTGRRRRPGSYRSALVPDVEGNTFLLTETRRGLPLEGQALQRHGPDRLTRTGSTRAGPGVQQITMNNVGDHAPALAKVLGRTDNAALLQRTPKPVNIFYPIQVKGHKKDKHRVFLSAQRPMTFADETMQLEVTLLKMVYRLVLKKNSLLAAPGYQEKSMESGASDMLGRKPDTDCYYQGFVRRFEKTSRVALSACGHGLRAVIHLHSNLTYLLQPLHGVVVLSHRAMNGLTEKVQRVAHMAYRLSTAGVRGSRCGNLDGRWGSYPQLHQQDFHIAISNAQRQVEPLELRRIDLALIMDSDVYLGLNRSAAAVASHAKQLVNAADLYLSGSRIRLSLGYLEVWDSIRRFDFTHSARATLQQILLYRKKALSRVRKDIVVLVTLRDFSEDVYGMAIPDSICTERAVAVIKDNLTSSLGVGAARLVHMVGHVMAVKHDESSEDGSSSCDDAAGCIMSSRQPSTPLNSTSSRLSEWSRKQFGVSLLSHCLARGLKPPPKIETHKQRFSQTCGNGVKERGEECDCGTPKECNATDPCCDPLTCLLHSWATCNQGACCRGCVARPAGHVCREKRHDCDVQEQCDGVHSQCPADEYAQDGWPCGASGFCYRGRCPTHDTQCAAIWGPGSTKGHDNCYNQYNIVGAVEVGHCGLENENSLRKCATRDVLCGSLYCQHGGEQPVISSYGRIYRTIDLTINRTVHQCKFAAGNQREPLARKAASSLVRNGTRCGEEAVCVQHRCVPIASLPGRTVCPGELGSVCSGHGVCSQRGVCVCEPGYSGRSCQLALRPTPSPTVRVASVTSQPLTFADGVTEEQVTEEQGFNLKLLLIILGAVLGACLLVFLAAWLLYRRRAPNHKKGLKKQQKRNSKEESLDDPGRAITFGHMPSYREDKKKRRKRQLSSISDDEGGEGSVSPRAEHITVVHDSNAKQPERGILKNRHEGTQRLQETVAPLLSATRCDNCGRHQEPCYVDSDIETGSPYGSLDSLSLAGSDLADSCHCHSTTHSVHSTAEHSASAGDALSNLSGASSEDQTFSDGASTQLPPEPEMSCACDSDGSSEPGTLPLPSVPALLHSRSPGHLQASGLSSSLENVAASHLSSRDNLNLSQLSLGRTDQGGSEPSSGGSRRAEETQGTGELQLKHIDTLMALWGRDEDEPGGGNWSQGRGGETDSWQGGVPRPHSPATSEDVRSSEPEAERSFRRYPQPQQPTPGFGRMPLVADQAGYPPSSLVNPINGSLSSGITRPSWMSGPPAGRSPAGRSLPPGHSLQSAFRPLHSDAQTHEQQVPVQPQPLKPQPYPLKAYSADSPLKGYALATDSGPPLTSLKPVTSARDDSWSSGSTGSDDTPRKRSSDYGLVTFSTDSKASGDKNPTVRDIPRKARFLRQQQFMQAAD